MGGGPVPELAVVVVAPAPHFAVCQQGARVSPTEGDARRRRDAQHAETSVTEKPEYDAFDDMEWGSLV